jgi:hypothetical protein
MSWDEGRFDSAGELSGRVGCDDFNEGTFYLHFVKWNLLPAALLFVSRPLIVYNANLLHDTANKIVKNYETSDGFRRTRW